MVMKVHSLPSRSQKITLVFSVHYRARPAMRGRYTVSRRYEDYFRIPTQALQVHAASSVCLSLPALSNARNVVHVPNGEPTTV